MGLQATREILRPPWRPDLSAPPTVPTAPCSTDPALAEAPATYRAQVGARADSGSPPAAREPPRGAWPRVVTQGAGPVVITPRPCGLQFHHAPYRGPLAGGFLACREALGGPGHG